MKITVKRMFLSVLSLVLTANICLLCGCTPAGGESSSDSDSASAAVSEVSAQESTPPAVPKLDGSLLVVFGDSITAFGTWGKTAATNANMRFFNGALGGITTAQGLDRFDAFVASREPDFVTFCFGMNDLIMLAKDQPRVSTEKFAENLREMISRTRELGAVPILMTTNPLNNAVFYAAQGADPSFYTSYDSPLALLDTYNDVTRSVAAKTGCALVDTRSACDAKAITQIVNNDGIHLSTTGNEVFAEALTSFLLGNFESDPNAERVGEEKPRVLAKGETASLIPAESSGWYTEKGKMTVTKRKDGAFSVSNTDGLWPDAQYVLSKAVAVDAGTGYITCKLKTAAACTSLVLYFRDATPSAYTDNSFIVLTPYLGGKTEAGSGDLSPNQTIDIRIPLSDLPLSSGAFDDDGNVVFNGLKLYVAGTAYSPVTVTELSVTAGE